MSPGSFGEITNSFSRILSPSLPQGETMKPTIFLGFYIYMGDM